MVLGKGRVVGDQLLGIRFAHGEKMSETFLKLDVTKRRQVDAKVSQKSA
jgi:hypothetical protein